MLLEVVAPNAIGHSQAKIRQVTWPIEDISVIPE
jgi:hypothetical protein